VVVTHLTTSAQDLTGIAASSSLRMDRSVLKEMAIGINHEKDNAGSAHAEEVALDKLCRNKSLRKNRIVDVYLLVIRLTCSSTSETYTLNNSRPCVVCVKRMVDALDFGFRIKKVFYSNSQNEIVSVKFSTLLEEEHYVTKFYKKKLPKKCSKFKVAIPAT
jgi:deoxycytidylate deaminase